MYKVTGNRLFATDGYWFGKREMFGDTFPHYWSVQVKLFIITHFAPEIRLIGAVPKTLCETISACFPKTAKRPVPVYIPLRSMG
jgi:hypothetical protein